MTPRTTSDVAINGGSFEIASGDDAVHADGNVSITGGEILITRSYEGIEGLSIDISGGNVSIVSDDDGLNSAAGNDGSGFGWNGGMFESTEGVYINISGGMIRINASGDGIDSNGDLTVSGGTTYVFGPTDNWNGAIDYNGSGVISGGVIVALGPSGMSQSFGNSSTQGVISVTVNGGAAGSVISLYDENGTLMISLESEKTYSSVLISCPGIDEGGSYVLNAGTYSTEITMNGLIYGSGGGFPWAGGGRPGRW